MEMTDERYLRHVTVDTGHERRFPLSEVNPDIMEQLKPLLTESIKFGKPMHVGAGFWVLAVLEKATTLRADIWHGGPEGQPLVSMSVTGADSMQDLPTARVRLESLHDPKRTVSPEVVGALGDLERCLAWTWLYYF